MGATLKTALEDLNTVLSVYSLTGVVNKRFNMFVIYPLNSRVL